MDKHEQYNLDKKEEAKDDFVSLPNLLYTDKDLNVKDTYFVTDTEENSLTGQRVGVKRVSESYTALRQDYYIGCSPTTTITITLPPASIALEGRVYEIKDESGSAATNIITIDGDGSETIDGQTTQTISSNYGFYKLLVSNGAWYSFSQSYFPVRYNAGNSGTSITLNFSNGGAQFLTLTDNCTVTLSNPVNGGRYILELKQDGTGSRTVTFPSTVKWSGGVAPTLTTTASRTDIITLYYNGTNYAGAYTLNYIL
jgi:hypothetical protein